MKRLTIYLVLLLALDAVVFYHLGRQDQLTEIRQKYPHLYNFKKNDGCCRPAEHDDIWITDSARVHLYVRGKGWKKLN